MRAATLLLAVSLGSACATTTKVSSDPPGAAIKKDGKDVGKAPIAYESKMWIWESEKLMVTAPGHKPKQVELKRSEIDWLPAVAGGCLTLTVCGCVVGIPIFLAGGLKMPPETKIVLEKAPANEPRAPIGEAATPDEPPLSHTY